MASLVHAAWRDGVSAECGISSGAYPKVTIHRQDVTCRACRERLASKVATDCAIPADDVRKALWPAGDRE